jgi:hypothetical protein
MGRGVLENKEMVVEGTELQLKEYVFEIHCITW